MMQFNQASSPHLAPVDSVQRVMRTVLWALLPGIAAAWYLFGWGVLTNIAIAMLTALLCEALMLALRKKPLRMFLRDGSALVTALLLALCLPQLAPWWLTVLATAFAIIVAKHLYGGLGYNPFNPAMVGYVVALISFPTEMTQWVIPHTDMSLWETLTWQFTGVMTYLEGIHGYTQATPLDTLKTQLGQGLTVGELADRPWWGVLGGQAWETLGAAFLLGGLWLLFRRVITWHIPVAMLLTLFLCALVFYTYDPDRYAPPLFHLFSGGTLLGAFFIATDPVSASTTPRGRLYYGAGIALLTYIIRTWGGYPDGIAFAVLLMNMAVPTIDYYTQPRVFGQRREGP